MLDIAGPFTQAGTLFGKGALPVIERSKAFLEERHKVIAHNIANVNTRYYKAIDLPEDDFQHLLGRAIRYRDEKPIKVFEMVHNDRVWGDWGGNDDFQRIPNNEGILRHGDNNVDIDKQVAMMSRNQMLFKTMNSLARKQYDLLRSTIRETA
ncbi:MAG: hypothetical protein KDB07_04125 [Planctomycetes bacterium]|nr:hypothetical protein [Planctomycetota bacterium]